MGIAAYKKTVEVSANGTTAWLKLPATSPSLDLSGDVLDDTTLATGGTGYRSRILGLNDWSVSCDSNYTAGNAALALVRSSKLARNDVFVRYLPEGTTAGGFKGKACVENFNLSGEVGGLETVSITLQANGPLSAA